MGLSSNVRANVSVVNGAFTIAVARNGRQVYKFENESDSDVKVREGTGASTADYTYILHPGDFFEDAGATCWSGIFSGYCDAATPSGTLTVTEGP